MAYANVYTGDFSGSASAVAAGATIAGLKDRRGGQATVAGGQLVLSAQDAGNYFQGGLTCLGANNQQDQRVRASIPAGLVANTRSYCLAARVKDYGNRLSYYGLVLFCFYGVPTVGIELVGQNTDQTWLVSADASAWFNDAHTYGLEFRAEGVQNTLLTAVITDTTSSTQVYTTNIQDGSNDSRHPLQAKLLAGILTTTLNAAGGGGISPVNALTIDTQYSAPAVVAPRPVLVSRS